MWALKLLILIVFFQTTRPKSTKQQGRRVEFAEEVYVRPPDVEKALPMVTATESAQAEVTIEYSTSAFAATSEIHSKIPGDTLQQQTESQSETSQSTVAAATAVQVT